MRLDEDFFKKIDRIASDSNVSRQKLIETILKRAITDKDFSIEVE